MPTITNPISLGTLTDATLTGAGVYDTLMRAQKAHLDEEFKGGRIKGSEYATVYLGAMQAVLNAAIQFTLQKDASTFAARKAEAEVLLVEQQTINAGQEFKVLVAQECKLKAEFDVLQEQKLKTAAETTLMNQRILTEKAQTTSIGVDADSVVGRQKALYAAQTSGYQRDAEQKAADLMIKTWATRRTTDEATVADATNMLNDTAVGRAVTKMLNGIQA